MSRIIKALRTILTFPLMLALGAVSHNTNTTETISTENKEFYDRALLKRCLPELVFHRFGQKRPIPKNSGGVIVFRKYEALPPSTTALTEGVTPEGRSLSVSEVRATPEQYGDFVTTTDKIDLIGIDPTVTEAATLCGEQAGITIDTVTRDIVCSGTNVFYANGMSTSDVGAGDVMTGAIIKKAVRTLRRQNIKPAVDNKFFALVIHPDVSYDITEDPLWQDISKYNGGTRIEEGEVGKIHGAKVFESTNALIKEGQGADEADIYCSMLIGSDAYGVVDIEGGSKPEIIIKALGSGGTEDPLNQRATVGWKALFTAVRLNELAMVRVETGASA